MLHLQVTCEIQNKRQEGYCACVDHVRVFEFHGCAKSKPQFLTQVYTWMVCQLFNLGSVCWKRCPVSQPRGTLRVTSATKVIPSHSYSDNRVFESVDHVPLNIPNSTHSTQFFMFEDTAAVIHVINRGRTPNRRHVTRRHKVDLDWLCESVDSDHSMLIEHMRTSDQLADMLTKGIFTTMQWHLFLIWWQIRRPYESNDVNSFSHKPFSCSAFGKLQAMSQVTTQAESVDQIRNQYAPNVLKSGCALSDHLTLEQLSNHEFIFTQDHRNLLAGMLFSLKAERDLLHVDTSSQILRKQRLRETIGPFDGEVFKMHEAEVSRLLRF